MGECRRHFRHGSSPQILTQLLEITPMDRYLYLLGRNRCASLPLLGAAQCCRVAKQKPKDVSASQILCNINVVTRLQSKGATLSLHSVLSEHMPSCSFPLQSSYRAQMVPGLLHQTSELLCFFFMPILVQTMESEELRFNWQGVWLEVQMLKYTKVQSVLAGQLCFSQISGYQHVRIWVSRGVLGRNDF